MTTVAALQIDARLGELAYNLAQVRNLAEEAAGQGAKIIAVPEFFTTPIVLDDRVRTCVLPPENDALDLLRNIATKHKVLIGGSYLEKRGGDVFNCYTLVRPDGTVTRHDKDIPTMVENAFYVAGSTDGIHQTEMGTVGTAVCWEQIRTQTVGRLKGQIDFLMTGTHWWGMPKNWPLRRSSFEKNSAANLALFHSTPGTLSKLLGVANIHASHCGSIKGRYAIWPRGLLKVPYETDLQGETQIVDNNGMIVALRTREEGPGVVIADIDLVPRQPTLELPNRFWIPDLPDSLIKIWDQQNAYGKAIYKRAKRASKF